MRFSLPDLPQPDHTLLALNPWLLNYHFLVLFLPLWLAPECRSPFSCRVVLLQAQPSASAEPLL